MTGRGDGAAAVWALGAMSGTSLDGVDAAMVLTDGLTISELGQTGYRRYSPEERAVLRAALGPDRDTEADEAAAEIVETAHAALLASIPGSEIVGFHGQTLFHDPARGVTLQAGDGAVLAEVLGLPVVWDFRSTDVEMGGQGAPLAPFFHHAAARHVGARAPVAFLNLGGVGNLTWVDPRIADPAAPGALLAFDTGPANAPLDDLMQARLGAPHDEGGVLARQGKAAESVLETLLAHPYFARIPPKSLDRDAFRFLGEAVAELSDADAAATLTAAVAASVEKAMEHCPAPPERLLVTGGGRRNPMMLGMIAAALDCPVDPVETVGLDGDMLEAQAFAFLAVRVMRGLPTSAPGTTGVRAPVGGGRIDRPRGLKAV